VTLWRSLREPRAVRGVFMAVRICNGDGVLRSDRRLHLPTRVVLGALLLACAWLAGANLMLLQVSSRSMEPALASGTLLVVTRVGIVCASGTCEGPRLERGQIVIFHSGDGSAQVKRVSGLAGDRVHIKDGALIVNGAPVDEPWVNHHDEPVPLSWPATTTGVPRDIVIPPNHVFVLGDNRGASYDSRFTGSIPVSSVYGVVRLVL
jgi:signal peptidase I